MADAADARVDVDDREVDETAAALEARDDAVEVTTTIVVGGVSLYN